MAVITLVTTSVHAEQGKHLFILSGQSNMAGLKPETSFTPAVEKAFGKENVIVVHDAHGGSPIRRWLKDWKPAPGKAVKGNQADGVLYASLMGKVKPAIEGQKIDTVTFVWMQGERDAKEGHGSVYAASLRMLIDQLKADLQLKEMSFVIGRLSDHGITGGRNIPDWPVVREAQVQVAEADPLGVWIDTDELNGGGNGLHYGNPGFKNLGELFAKEAIKIVRKDDPAPSP